MAGKAHTAKYDVTAIGNAIVDIIGKCDDSLLAEIGSPKGGMRLVDAQEIAAIYDKVGPTIEISGGSAANTVAGIASFGGSAGFVGRVADDDFGRVFAHDIRSIGVAFNGAPLANSEPTSRALILVTPDGERTMNTFLGISTHFDEDALDQELIADSEILYLEGYLFDRDAAKAAFKSAFKTAKKNNRRVAMTLSDGFCVDRHRDAFLAFIKSGVDILFANESEITSLYQTESFEEAARKAEVDAKMAVLTRSAKGSFVIANGTTTEIDIVPVPQVVDTTGAGDLYAAGFLYGLTHGQDLATCGRLASIAAAEIISHVGARPEIALSELARNAGITT